MDYPFACGHTLNFTRFYDRSVTQTVFMLQNAFCNDGYYLHIVV